MYCIVLYCIVLCCTVLYCTVLYCTVLYCIVLYCTVLYCIVLYCTVLYCTVMYCTVQQSTIRNYALQTHAAHRHMMSVIYSPTLFTFLCKITILVLYMSSGPKPSPLQHLPLTPHPLLFMQSCSLQGALTAQQCSLVRDSPPAVHAAQPLRRHHLPHTPTGQIR